MYRYETSGMGTALWNESADFHQFYKDFIVKDSNSPAYNEKRLKAVKLYNDLHI